MREHGFKEYNIALNAQQAENLRHYHSIQATVFNKP
jgi:hypothetical protein